jgi:hydrogen peroxide-dependent heme synthase
VSETALEAAADVRPAIPSEGWGVLHLAFAVRHEAEASQLAAAVALLDELEAEPDYQVRAYAVLGQRAGFGVLLVGPDFSRLHRLHRDLRAALGDALDDRPELSFVSLTEASEYLEDDGSEAAAARRRGRLYPADLPRTRMICFYPMSKRREAHANWYALDFAERKRVMWGHGKTGRGFAGRVTQLITASTGLSDWEWGVTLFADDPKAIKDVVYEMRYDEGSAIYAEFGPFVVGLVAPIRDALAEAGLART